MVSLPERADFYSSIMLGAVVVHTWTPFLPAVCSAVNCVCVSGAVAAPFLKMRLNVERELMLTRLTRNHPLEAFVVKSIVQLLVSVPLDMFRPGVAACAAAMVCVPPVPHAMFAAVVAHENGTPPPTLPPTGWLI